MLGICLQMWPFSMKVFRTLVVLSILSHALICANPSDSNEKDIAADVPPIDGGARAFGSFCASMSVLLTVAVCLMVWHGRRNNKVVPIDEGRKESHTAFEAISECFQYLEEDCGCITTAPLACFVVCILILLHSPTVVFGILLVCNVCSKVSTRVASLALIWMGAGTGVWAITVGFGGFCWCFYAYNRNPLRDRGLLFVVVYVTLECIFSLVVSFLYDRSCG